jgi:PHD/YefM family antitoxin component YafN of YafNO toxin-antitoxin module
MAAPAVTGFSVEISSTRLAQMMEMVREHGQPTRITLSGIGAVIYVAEAKGQVRQAALLEKRLRQIDPSATVRRVTSI